MFKVIEGGFEPVRSTKYSAYVDLFAKEDIAIGAGETKIVKLGVKLDLDLIDRELLGINACKPDIANKNMWDRFLKRHYLEVALRSSLAVKGLIIANGIGIIDLDYPDEIGLIVHNPFNIEYEEIRREGRLCGEIDIVEIRKEKFEIKKGDKVAQCTLKEHKGYLMGYESDVIRISGFGSTGA